MEKTLREALLHRRSYYSLSDRSPVDDGRIEEIVRFAVRYMPSAFNSQSSRLVLLLGDHHAELWRIVLDALRELLSDELYARSRERVERSFASGHGTVLFFEDQDTVSELQRRYPTYADNFPVWSQQTSAMHQLAVWTLLEETGLGASLQHYNPLIDNRVRRRWDLPESWRLIAQMPFGTPLEAPSEKTSEPLEKRIRIFR
ncbi:nitroreductase family protein [Alistipes sp.]|jgi:predicted oxidoreductase related to nitroreductase|uniref:nitroreductase family protein n=1 Tax=Alistipes sp. TaxID=1872444 RepID=UPI003AB2D991